MMVDKKSNTLLIKRMMRSGGRIMLTIVSIFIICVLVCVSVLIVHSTGKPRPFLDESGMELEGSISEKIHVNINGIQQGMFIKGMDKSKPILLLVHGGPGMPEYVVSEENTTVLEKYFIVCYWDQRGAGLSYSNDIPVDTINTEQLVSDTIGVTNYLRNRFGQDKIYLMGHSWGSFLGIQAVAKAPELYKAYIAMSQVSNQIESERLSYEYIVGQYRKTGNKSMLHKLEKSPIDKATNLPTAYWSMRDMMMHSLGVGTTHKMKSVITGIFLPVMKSSEYTLKEKINLWRYKFTSPSIESLNNEMYAADLNKKVPKVEVPVYFCHGIYDYTISYNLAKEYFNKLQAPIKGFYTFDESAHSPMFEEPEKISHILEDDVLKGTNGLAD